MIDTIKFELLKEDMERQLRQNWDILRLRLRIEKAGPARKP